MCIIVSYDCICVFACGGHRPLCSLQRPDLIAQIVPSPMTLKWDRTIQKLLANGAIGEVLVVTGAAEDRSGAPASVA